MSNIPSDLQVHQEVTSGCGSLPNGQVEVGITDHAQEALGDLVFVEVPQSDRRLRPGEACAVVESVKAASDVYSPVSGPCRGANANLAQRPELLNQDPYGVGWLMRVEVESGRGRRLALTAAEYAQFLDAAE